MCARRVLGDWVSGTIPPDLAKLYGGSRGHGKQGGFVWHPAGGGTLTPEDERALQAGIRAHPGHRWDEFPRIAELERKRKIGPPPAA